MNLFTYSENFPVTNLTAKEQQAFDKVHQKVASRAYRFIRLVEEQTQLQEVNNLLNQLGNWWDVLVVVGIGGSDLGGRAVKQALDQPWLDGKEVVFVGEHTDPGSIYNFLETYTTKNILFNIVSKSGKTTETMAYYQLFKQTVQTWYEDSEANNWQQHFVFTTSHNSGLLYEEALMYDIPVLSIPEDVGGRFSVLSSVGVFPAEVMGIDAKKLLDGARDIVGFFELEEDLTENIPVQIALQQYRMLQQGIHTAVMWPYAKCLNGFARWFRQLWAESLGKNGTGILPIQSLGPADQHSQLQFYNQGKLLSSFLFLRVNNWQQDYILQKPEREELSYLENVSFGKLTSTELEATAKSLSNQGRVVSILDMENINANTMGRLFMVFEIAVVYLAELLEVDPFNQPGVEESKDLIKAKLQSNV